MSKVHIAFGSTEGDAPGTDSPTDDGLYLLQVIAGVASYVAVGAASPNFLAVGANNFSVIDPNGVGRVFTTTEFAGGSSYRIAFATGATTQSRFRGPGLEVFGGLESNGPMLCDSTLEVDSTSLFADNAVFSGISASATMNGVLVLNGKVKDKTGATGNAAQTLKVNGAADGVIWV